MMTQRHVSIGPVTAGNDLPMVLIAGPCALEGREHGLEMAGKLVEMCSRLDVGLIFKTSFDKANRTSNDSPRGVGLDDALPIFNEIRATYDCAVLTDVHLPEQCEALAGAVDVLQIPAFLCRQTDLLVAAARTGLAVNVKKGQFLAPWDMPNVVDKLTGGGCERVMLCERGTSFGYNTLVSDMRSLPQLVATGWPVIFDATHSVQQPGGAGTSSGGQREFAPVLARAAVAVGVASVFIETHEAPERAPADSENMIPFNDLEGVVETLLEFDRLAKSRPISLGES